MKKLFVLLALACFSVTAFAADGAALYKKCAVCHGAKGEKKYLNKVPPLHEVKADERLKLLKEYKAGKLNKFGMGAIMKLNVGKLSDADLEAVNKHIDTLK